MALPQSVLPVHFFFLRQLTHHVGAFSKGVVVLSSSGSSNGGVISVGDGLA
jgi:hypothetical protein